MSKGRLFWYPACFRRKRGEKRGFTDKSCKMALLAHVTRDRYADTPLKIKFIVNRMQ